ncbi:MAG TPA: PorP/SprF family type IX secretion system membrane protein [Saprospiraceae bacterium]|nr:PorP/SprF family type IX secretion system membrane protein [Saprospiraceae bacterium]HMQ84812.1 PorP/SprF family type IX secretion system membrane protein [Saprospiraceae bacterium]
MSTYFTRVIFVFSALFFLQELQAQDPRFSQFYASPLELNPAMTGVFEGKMRFVANYRELYASILDSDPFRTIAASFDVRQRVQKGDFFGYGLTALRDQAGAANLTRTRVGLSTAFMKQLGGSRYATYDQYLIAGAQLGFGQHSLNWQKLWFSQQFNGAGGFVDFEASSGEATNRTSTDMYLDFNAGLLWYVLFDDNRSLYVGGALNHLNTPNVSFVDVPDEELHSRWVGHAGGELPFNSNISILPAVVAMGQHKYFSTTVGANLRYTNRDWKEVAIRAGGWVHLSNQLEEGIGMDAFVVTTFLEMERWNIGLSYDITTSSLAAANNSRGAFELSFIYIQPATWRTNVKCPNF